MNPSANGWIKKLLNEHPDNRWAITNTIEFYNRLKSTGFIYGSNVSTVLDSTYPNIFSEEERCKINLLLSYYFIHVKNQKEVPFINHLIEYYKAISLQKQSFFEEFFSTNSSDGLLEKMIHKRIHLDHNVISKNFSHFLINALLFVDILGYDRYLKGETNIRAYVTNLEAAFETIVFSVLEIKTEKTEYDTNLIKLLESSMRYKNNELLTYDEAIKLIHFDLEKRYIIDLVAMASWTDKTIDANERNFLHRLKQDLSLTEEDLQHSLDALNYFYEHHKDNVAFLSSKNLAQSFYDNSSKLVIKLIRRNSKRLIRELTESKQAMYLLAQSTHRNLTEEEHKKIQSQLIDIFKSIPSLAIFMLPGGMLLLPLFIKFIPKLLPSAFDDNRIDEDQKS